MLDLPAQFIFGNDDPNDGSWVRLRNIQYTAWAQMTPAAKKWVIQHQDMFDSAEVVIGFETYLCFYRKKGSLYYAFATYRDNQGSSYDYIVRYNNKTIASGSSLSLPKITRNFREAMSYVGL